MKNYALIFIHVACAFVLVSAACTDAVQTKLQGNWHSADNQYRLKITDKQFTVLNDLAVPEDYFVKGDTIFTSFEGSRPYSRFVIKALDEHNLKLVYPDSAVVSYVR